MEVCLIVMVCQYVIYNVLVLRQGECRALYPIANPRVNTNKRMYHDVSRNMSSAFKGRAN